MEYRGGTYISQIEAMDAVGALRTWAKNLDTNEVAEFGPAAKRRLIQNIYEGSPPVLINDTVNVWCQSALCRGSLMLINIIQTER